MTGGSCPMETDAVLMQEHTRRCHEGGIEALRQ